MTSSALLSSSSTPVLPRQKVSFRQVVLDVRTLSLHLEAPQEPLVFGQPVRWRFVCRSVRGEIEPLPAGWSPMLVFGEENGEPSRDFGPFRSLLHVSGANGETTEITGEWSDERIDSPRRYPCAAVVHRGIGLDHGGAWCLLSTPITEVHVEPDMSGRPLPLRVSAPEHRVDLRIFRASPTAKALRIVPREPVKAFTNSTLVWSFDRSVGSVYPLILFYGSEPMDLAMAGPQQVPHRYCRIFRQRIEMWGFKTVRRRFFYEGAVLNQQQLAVELISTGDPQIDNQGIPFPP